MKNKFLGLIATPILGLSLISCGHDTRDWPRINLNIEPEDVLLYSAHYIGNANDYREHTDETKTTNNTEAIKENLIGVQNMPYKEELMDFDEDRKWGDFLEITITTKSEARIIKYIGYGITVGAVCFKNDEWHFLPGDFVGFLFDEFIE